MGIEDIILFINREIEKTAPSMSKEYHIIWNDKSFNLITDFVMKTLEEQRISIESTAKKEKGISMYTLEKATDELLREIFVQASMHGRKEISKEDFRSAILSLKWWPLCESGERSFA
jgi:hypothetical protein